MFKMLSVSVLCFLSFLSGGSAVTSAYHHRTTSFDDLKSIDGLVSSGLPLFTNGFFINTASGPVLIKSKDEDGLKKPLLNPGYYSTLPRVIPQGLEGIAISHFNLGTAIPAQEPFYQPQAQNRAGQFQYSSEPNAQESFVQQPVQQQQQYLREIQPQQQQEEQEASQQQRHQRFLTQPHQTHQRFSSHETQRSYLAQQGQQQRLQRQHFAPPQAQQQQAQGTVAQETFQLNNFLTAGDTPTSYQSQNQEFGHQPFSSRQLIRNPTVEQTLALEEDLPEALRNPFYKNEQVASALAQESLPVDGEDIVGSWDTTKIQKIKIMELLRGAGFL